MDGKLITVRKNQVEKAKDAILFHLKTKTLTSWEAWELWGVTRLASYICELRKEGYNIKTISVPHTNKFGTKGTYAKYKYINPIK